MRVSLSERAGLLPQNETCTERWSIEDTVAAVNGVFVSSTVDLHDVECQSENGKNGTDLYFCSVIALTTKLFLLLYIIFYFQLPVQWYCTCLLCIPPSKSSS